MNESSHLETRAGGLRVCVSSRQNKSLVWVRLSGNQYYYFKKNKKQLFRTNTMFQMCLKLCTETDELSSNIAMTRDCSIHL